MQSMTAYSKIIENNIEVEIATYNSRGLDCHFFMPKEYTFLKDKIQKIISKKLNRGRVDIRIFIKRELSDNFAINLDTNKLKIYKKALSDIDKVLNTKTKLTASFIFKHSKIIDEELSFNVDEEFEEIQKIIEKALTKLCAMRKKEGTFLSKDISKRLKIIENYLKKIEERAPKLIEIYKEKLIKKLDKHLDKKFEIDQNRLHQEILLFTDKIDITEEIVRAKSHLKQFKTIIKKTEPIGTKLNFLIQEFLREFNTIASKVSDDKTSHIVVDLKTELEKIREQVQNIE